MARKSRSSGGPKRASRVEKSAGLGRQADRLAGGGRLRDAIRQHMRDLDAVRNGDVSAQCKELFEQLRKNCPDLLPDEPLEAGQTGPEIDLDPKAASALLTAAARKVSDGAARVTWTLGGNALEVTVDELSVKMVSGRMLVIIPVRCDQTGKTDVTVAFAVGSRKRPAGMIAATGARPAGPPEIIDVWGEALTALAWGAVIELTQSLAFEAGEDLDRAGLIPASLVAEPEGIRVLTMARHRMDRRPR